MLPDWQHEKELRIVKSDVLGILESNEQRVFTYDYDTLDGIILGMNTRLSDKVKILRILDRKVATRTAKEPFKIYQARYNELTGRIKADHLNLI